MVEEADEIVGSLVYVARSDPCSLASGDRSRTGTLEVRATDPDVRVVVEIGTSIRLHDGPCDADAVVLTGDAVEVVEALSFRVPLDADLADDDRWVLGNLGEVFDQTG